MTIDPPAYADLAAEDWYRTELLADLRREEIGRLSVEETRIVLILRARALRDGSQPPPTIELPPESEQ